MENTKKVTLKNSKKYLTNTNALLAVIGIGILLWVTSLMNWVTAVTGASSTVNNAADSISSFFKLGDASGSNALSSLESTMKGNLWNFVEHGEKSSTSIGIFFLSIVIIVIVLALLALSKQTKGLKTATGIVGIISSILLIFIALGYAGIIETASKTSSDSSYGLASTEFKYGIGYTCFILLTLLLFISSIVILVTRSKNIEKHVTF